jgi:hypothetical protein
MQVGVQPYRRGLRVKRVGEVLKIIKNLIVMLTS